MKHHGYNWKKILCFISIALLPVIICLIRNNFSIELDKDLKNVLVLYVGMSLIYLISSKLAEYGDKWERTPFEKLVLGIAFIVITVLNIMTDDTGLLSLFLICAIPFAICSIIHNFVIKIIENRRNNGNSKDD